MGVQALLRENPGAANELDDSQVSPLFAAVSRSEIQPEIVKALLVAGADPNFVFVRPTFEMPDELENDTAEMFAELGIDLPPGFDELSSSSGDYSESLLSIALKEGDVEIIEMLRAH